ncbi:MAG: glutamine--fructose-6-phosphate transaminase (isomerizing) [Holosporaceae bacterium]|jgi:glucosamine--fructose-6-phosphate aminotransferase (isomerizing)|nr:glutamine--fructose-6-phosphate transaminase (isomerizing) [Holosporaceae bacterium]
MCGIIGLIGNNEEDVVDQIILGLEKLEYRGYDSSGIAVLDKDCKIKRLRAVGKLHSLKAKLAVDRISGSIGIGHNRWATHGTPTEKNAHPIISKNVAVVHNGIVENYKELKFDLKKDGCIFDSDTDTEVIASLLQRGINNGASPREAFRKMLQTIEGSYAIAVMFDLLPDTIMIAKQRSPLVIGIGANHCVGSDITSIASFCSEVVYLEDGENAEITKDGVLFFNRNFNQIEPSRHRISIEVIDSGKGKYQHYMQKEIMEQPSALRRTMLYNKIDKSILNDISRILILACGTSYHAGMVAKYWFEKFLKIPTTVEIASEYRYRSPVIEPNTLVIAITQSGETIDTIEAVEYVKIHSNSKVLAISNVKNSAISRIADFVFYTEAGAEIGVASTKAFTAQLAILASIAFMHYDFLIQELQSFPTYCEEVLNLYGAMNDLAHKLCDAKSAIYIGRGSLYPIALEGALKLKEISYIHAEGFAAGEMKHGPIALIDDNVPVICLCPDNELFDKTHSNVQVALARGKNVIVFTDFGKSEILSDEITKIILPKIHVEFVPILYVIPLQMLAYSIALLRNTDVDKPRNLAKSVTVE